MFRTTTTACTLALAMAAPLAGQQVITGKPIAKPSGASPMTGRPPAGGTSKSLAAHAAKPVATTLTVRYLTDINTPVTVSAEGLTFSCGPDPRENPTPVTACVAQTSAATVELAATYGKGTPLAPMTPQVSGKQWNGACAGTTGTVCTLAMTGPQVVGIDYYSKP